MKTAKSPGVDLRLKYRKTLEFAFVLSLLLHVGFFLARPNINATTSEARSTAVKIEVEDIPPTEQVKRPPAPPRPSIPIPTESETVPEDLTIETTDINYSLTEIPPPPPSETSEDIEGRYVFIPYDEPPLLIGGYAAILKNLRYPEIARKAGLQARVVVGVLIDKSGNPVKTQILKSSGTPIGFDEAARAAVMAARWKPAVQRDRPVKVWIAVPIKFELRYTERVGT